MTTPPDPTGGPIGALADAPSSARDLVNAPAIVLMLVGGLGVLLTLFNFVTGGYQLSEEWFSDPELAKIRPMMESMMQGSAVVDVLSLLISAFVIFAAVQMRKLESWGVAFAGAIIAMVPCIGPCCCLGLPIGIWSLVVLNKPEVRSAFR